jgi:hypothetical protein
MWHVNGLDDSTLACVTRPPGSRTFDYTMPGGWLVSASTAGNWDIMSGTYSGSSPDSNACTTASSANPRALGAQPVYWRLLPGSQITKEYVCVWSQFAPPGSDPEDGWFYALPWLTEKTGAPRDMYLRLETIDYGALLDERAPILLYDSGEDFHVVSPGALSDFYTDIGDPDPTQGSSLNDATGLFAIANPAFAGLSEEQPQLLSLGYLRETYPSDPLFRRRSNTPAESNDYINARGNEDDGFYGADSAEMEADSAYGERVYGRVAYGSDGKLWLQYWAFYYYNPIEVLPHEGDWEMIQIGLDSNHQPEVAVYAQHEGGQTCPWSTINKSLDGERPVVYVAEGSHASYFDPDAIPLAHFYDHADGLGGGLLVPELDEIKSGTPAWVAWPGKWGGSSHSPDGPMFKGEQWDDPSAWGSGLDTCSW